MGVPVAIGAQVLLTLFFVNVWIARRRILLRSGGKELSVEVRWLFGTSRDRISVGEVARVEVQCGKLKATRFWDVYAVYPADRMGGMLARCYSPEEASAVGGNIANAIDRALVMA